MEKELSASDYLKAFMNMTTHEQEVCLAFIERLRTIGEMKQMEDLKDSENVVCKQLYEVYVNLKQFENE